MEVICLSDQHDLRSMFGEGFQIAHPWIKLLMPDEVEDAGSVRVAMVFRPGSDVLAPYPNLKLVTTPAAGIEDLVDHPGIDPDVVICRMIDPEQAKMMAGFAIWQVVGWQRQLMQYPALQRAGKWNVLNYTAPSTFPVGILGYGNMGKTLAGTLVELGFPVAAYASTQRKDGAVEVFSGPAGLAEIARTSQAVINMLPMTPQTMGILSSEFFARMRDDAILIHLGRGGHLNEEELCSALEAGRPGYAAIDVTKIEPPSPDHPFWVTAKS